MSMIEKAARAAYCASEQISYEGNEEHVEFWFDLNRCAGEGYDCEGDVWRRATRAVIQALMEPTPEMVESGCAAPLASFGNGQYGNPHPADVWQAMLTTILNEQQG